MSNPNQHIFPWNGSQTWDVDVLVIGGGPAGLAAVTRLRWMKTFNPTPLSVALVNSGPLGGLARLGNSILTGPALAFPAGELVSRLKKDLDAFPAPVINQKAVTITKNDNLFTTTFEDNSQITSISIIAACGMLDLRNIHTFWNKGVTATFGNRANILKILQRELGKAKQPVILGGPHLLQLQQTIQTLNPKTKILIPETGKEEHKNIFQGELQEIRQDHARMKMHIRLKSKDIILETDKIILEFNSLELSRTPLPKGLKPDQNGYLGKTEHQGLYMAGDCTGPPFSAVVALGEGAKAGLEAYQYTHQIKYNIQAPLFAYYGDPSVNDSTPDCDDFILHDNFIPVHLLSEKPKEGDPRIWESINGKTTLAKLQKKTGLDNKSVHTQIKLLLQQRAVTFRSTGKQI